jgi:hypothetical protein
MKTQGTQTFFILLIAGLIVSLNVDNQDTQSSVLHLFF